jgi:hypothetical protein
MILAYNVMFTFTPFYQLMLVHFCQLTLSGDVECHKSKSKYALTEFILPRPAFLVDIRRHKVGQVVLTPEEARLVACTDPGKQLTVNI